MGKKYLLEKIFFSALEQVRLDRLLKGEFRFPDAIGEYRFETSIKQFPKPYGMAVYRSGRKRAIAKIWQGRIKNSAYFGLRQEIEVIRTLNEVDKQKSRIAIVPYLDSSVTRNNLILLVEKIEGNSLYAESDNKFTGQYDQFLGKLRSLTLKLSAGQKEKFITKSGDYYLRIYPLTVVVAAVKHPEILMDSLQGLFEVWKRRQTLTGLAEFVLVHGDLHPANAFQNHKKMYLLDFGQSCLSFPESDYVTSHLCVSVKKHLRLLNEAEIKKKKGGGLARYFLLLVIWSTLYLSGSTSEDKVRHYKKLLHHAVDSLKGERKK